MGCDHPPPPPDAYTFDGRQVLGIAPDELFFPQPTRVVQRQGIKLGEDSRDSRMKGVLAKVLRK